MSPVHHVALKQGREIRLTSYKLLGKEIFWQKSPFRDWFQEQQAQNLLHCVTWPLQSLSHKTITHLQTILPKQHILPNHFKTICVHQAWGLAP